MRRPWLIILTILIACTQQESQPICDILPTDDHYGHADAYGYVPYTELEKAQECALQSGRPILILFTGWALSSPHLPWKIMQEEEVRKLVDEHYILTALYVDDRVPLDQIDSTRKTWKGKVMRTIGDKNLTFQIEHFQVNMQPCYALLDAELNVLAEPIGYTPLKDKRAFIDFLKKGINK